MNDLKSDLFPSPGCLEGRRLAGGGVWRGGGEVVPDVKVSSRLSGTHDIAHRTRISFAGSHARRFFFVFTKRDRFRDRGVKDT